MSSVAVPRAATAAARARRPGVTAVYRWELRKLLAQKRTFIGLGAALAVPLIFVIALAADNSGQGPTSCRSAASCARRASPSRSSAWPSARSGCCR